MECLIIVPDPKVTFSAGEAATRRRARAMPAAGRTHRALTIIWKMAYAREPRIQSYDLNALALDPHVANQKPNLSAGATLTGLEDEFNDVICQAFDDAVFLPLVTDVPPQIT